jgi:hypothetical protein
MATPGQKNVSDLERQAIALAEQLGRIAGTIEGTAEAWLNRQTLTDQLTRVRDGAAEMLKTLADGTEESRRAAAGTVKSFTETVRRTAAEAMSAARAGRSAQKSHKTQRQSKRKTTGGNAAAAASPDPARAPGKTRRKPAPSMRGVKKSDERIPKMRTAAAARQRRKSYA